MKHDWTGKSMAPPEELIATFGSARILKLPNGHLEIHGGTDQEKAQAHDWMKQFLTQEKGSTYNKRLIFSGNAVQLFSCPAATHRVPRGHLSGDEPGGPA
jgi:hypothetical protein